jgi:glycine betaine catabolism B
MSKIPDIVAGIAFVALAAVNVVAMLEASQTSRNAKTRFRLVAVHRAVGYLFVILFCIMVYSMSQRLAGLGITSHLPTDLVLHIVLALFLVPLLLLKLLMARRYKQSRSSLKALGIAIFVISFVLVSIPTFSELLHSARPGSLGLKLAVGLVVAMCVVQCILAFKKREEPRPPMEPPFLPEIALRPQVTSHGNPRSIRLLLVNTEQETHDTKTLRFQILDESSLCAKPGQFLTFQWTLEGKRVLRSYTISSSPIDKGYLEITPKRTESGYVSVFLNEQAKPGLTVDASGPHGRFYFDERLHRSIVLIAAGSGITPMISILRYVDDLKLTTQVRLLYCVRTATDIIFQNELARLAASLPNFKYEVYLSRPDPTWNGQSGRLSGKFVSQQLIGLDTPTYFICGPEGFMDNAGQILAKLGVSQDRILQESFGESYGSAEPRIQGEARAVETIVFMRSEKFCKGSAGNTLLEVAEANGVQIPYSCRQGMCGTCVTRVLSGTVRMDTEDGLTAEQKNAGYVLPCVSRAKGTVVVAA